jgi:hypothetical protein
MDSSQWENLDFFFGQEISFLLCSEWRIITGGSLYVNVTLSHISRFGNFVDGIYPIELEVKDTTYTDRSVSYLDLHLEIDIEEGHYYLHQTIDKVHIFSYS